MSAFMLAGKRAGLMGAMPPEKITTRALRGLGLHPDRKQTRAAAALAHLAFGAGGGIGFGLLRRRGGVATGVLQGVVYGSVMWAVSYLGWVPALGVMPRADRDRPGRPQVMLVAHWIYGAALGILLR